MSDELPQGWAAAALSQLTDTPKQDIISGPFGSNLRSEEYVGAGVPIIRLQNVDRNRFLEKNMRFITPKKARELSAHAFQAGDIVITKLGAPLGKACAIPESLSHGIVVADVVRVRIDESRFSKSYVLFAINSPAVANQINSEMMGSTRPRVNLNNVRGLEIPLAPLAEQVRIVAKLEKLFGQVDACRQRLAKIPSLLKRLRQSVLAAACSGRLTADWREENPSHETATSIVEKIRLRRETETRTQAQRQKLAEIYDREEENDSANLPDGWAFIALTKLCESFDYGTSTKSQPIGKVPVLRMGNIQNGRLDWEDLVYTSDESEIKAYQLKPKTVLFNRTNSPELVGKTAIYMGERPAIFAGYLIRVNQCPELDSDYLNFCLNTNYAREFCQSVKTDGVSQSNINAQKLGHFEVPFGPLPEQEEIVRRVDKLFALADQIEATFAEAQKRVDSITQSVLAKAFRGKLVPTEYELAKADGRSFESAEELLGRIKGNGNPTTDKRRGARAAK